MFKQITTEKAIELIYKERTNRLSANEREDILLDWWILDESDKEFFDLEPEIQYELIHHNVPVNARI